MGQGKFNKGNKGNVKVESRNANPERHKDNAKRESRIRKVQ
jgi:hypothetical protein